MMVRTRTDKAKDLFDGAQLEEKQTRSARVIKVQG
jgi:hypothetical protein